MALSESFNRFILKLGENLNKLPVKEEYAEKAPRPDSPFLLLLSEGDEEFNLNTNDMSPSEVELKMMDEPFDFYSTDSRSRHSSMTSAEENEILNFDSSEDVCDGYNSEKILRENSISLGENEAISMPESDVGSYEEEEINLKICDEQRSYRNKPMSDEEFIKLFDPSGRLVNEHELRRAIFKGGVMEDIRKDVWQFLFELYPFNSTTREREILKVEQTVRYEAMKIRWKKLLKTLVNEYEGVRYCPKWYTGCAKNTLPRDIERNAVSSHFSKDDIVSESDAVAQPETIKNKEQISRDEENCAVNSIDHADTLESLNMENDALNESKIFDSNNITLSDKLENSHHSQSDLGLCKNAACNSCKLSAVLDCDINPKCNKQKLECDEVANIAEILAEAMLDIENHDGGIKHDGGLIKQAGNNTELEVRCSAEEKQDDFHILSTHISSPRLSYDTIGCNPDNEIDHLDCSYSEDELSATSLLSNNLDDKSFPNPFTLSPEFVNNQESLYSKSERFVSSDIMKCDKLKCNHTHEMEILLSNSVINSNGDCNSADDQGNRSFIDGSSICYNEEEKIDKGSVAFTDGFNFSSSNGDDKCNVADDLDNETFDSKCFEKSSTHECIDAIKCDNTLNNEIEKICVSTSDCCRYDKNVNKLPFTTDNDILHNLENYSIENDGMNVENYFLLSNTTKERYGTHSNGNNLCHKDNENADRNVLDLDFTNSSSNDSPNQKFQPENEVSDTYNLQLDCTCDNHSEALREIVNDNIDGDLCDGGLIQNTCIRDFVEGKDINNDKSIVDHEKINISENKKAIDGIENENSNEMRWNGINHNVDNTANTGLEDVHASAENSMFPRLDSNNDYRSLLDCDNYLVYKDALEDGDVCNCEKDESRISYMKHCSAEIDSVSNIGESFEMANLENSNVNSNFNIHRSNNDSPENRYTRDKILHLTLDDSIVTGTTFARRSNSSVNQPDYCNEEKVLSESFDASNVSVSLTSEHLEKLPTWIVQVINASTPPTRRSRSLSKKPECKYTLDNEYLRAMDDDINNRKELMDIVENANKFLKEKANLETETILKSPDKLLADTIDNSFDKVTKNEEPPIYVKESTETLHSPFMSPITSSEVDLLVNDRLQFQLVTDNTENLSRKNSNSYSMCPYCNFHPEDSPKIVLPSSLGQDQLKFMEIQAQVFAAREPYDSKTISESIRVIDKDVPRTDRELPMFSCDDDIGLVRLRDALLTYAFFHPDVGYAQGMNDIMSRFLVVMGTESEAYWMFVNYMEHFKSDFMEEGMLQKIALVEQLLMKMDRGLYDYLQSTDMGLMFCHRWLLLNFKREFDYKEALRLFEITSSRHLEVSSLEAELERSKERAKEFVKDSAGSHLEEIFISPEFPFDIFICVAMLMECRHMIMDTSDLSAIYQILSNLPTTLDLQNVIRKAEELFYQYCRKSVVDCFQVIDELEVQDFKRKKRNSFSFTLR